MEVEKLTKNAQHALRRTMEKYSSSCRLILCSTSTSKIIPAIRSRCLGVRVAAPSLEEVTSPHYVCGVYAYTGRCVQCCRRSAGRRDLACLLNWLREWQRSPTGT